MYKSSLRPLLRFIVVSAVLIILLLLLLPFLPTEVADYGLWATMPALFLIGYIFFTRRIIEALILASLIAFIMASGVGFFGAFSSALLTVLMDEDMAWLIIVCGLMGSIIVLIEKSGGSIAFGNWIATKAKGKRSALVWTWILGNLIFIDDYLSVLTVASCMKETTDARKTSREMLAYIVDSTAAPVSMLVPISTWGVFVGRLLEINGVATPGKGIAFVIRTIPVNFYAWFALLLSFLVVNGWFPLLGGLKRGEQRVIQGGSSAPPDSPNLKVESRKPTSQVWGMINFLVPLLILLGVTIITDLDMQKGVLATIVTIFILYVGQGIMSAEEFAEQMVEGLKSMVMPLLLMVLAFLFSLAADSIGFTEQVITAVSPYMQGATLPVLVFLVLTVTEFITGTNWGMYIIALPIVLPLSAALGANSVLAVAAVLSAGVFGSHICFYSDATILSSVASGCDNYAHATSQLPYGPIAVGISALAFLISGFIM